MAYIPHYSRHKSCGNFKPFPSHVNDSARLINSPSFTDLDLEVKYIRSAVVAGVI